MGGTEDSRPPSAFLPPGLGVPGSRAPEPVRASPVSPSARVRTVSSSDDGSVVAGIGALLAAAGLFGYRLFIPYRVGAGPFIRVAPGWSSRHGAVTFTVIVLLAVCGLALVVRAGDWPAALMLAPAAMIGVLLATSAGQLDKVGIAHFGAGGWSTIAGALGCLLAVVMGTRQLARGSWSNDGDYRTRGPLTAVVAVAGLLAVVGMFTTRATYRTGFLSVPYKSVFSGKHQGWYWAEVLGILFVVVAVTAVAVTLGDAPRAGWFVVGIAPAVLVWDGEVVARVMFRVRGFQAGPGFWLLVIAAGLFALAGILQIAESG